MENWRFLGLGGLGLGRGFVVLTEHRGMTDWLGGILLVWCVRWGVKVDLRGFDAMRFA